MPFQCSICKLEYADEATAKACWQWCNTHNSCNFLIARQAVNKDQMSKKSANADGRYKEIQPKNN